MSLRQRPESFRLDYTHSLARGLVFAGLGGMPGTTHYHDSSLHGNAGTLTNMVPADDWTWVDELGRWGLDFDGSNDYAPLSKAIAIGTGNVSLSCWVLPIDSPSYTEGIIGRYPALADGTWYLGRDAGGYLGLHFGLAGAGLVKINSLATYTDGTWHHLAFTRDGTSYTLFVDGTEVASDTRTANNWGTNAPYIGRIGSGTGDYWYGGAADPLIHSRALSLPEIQTLANRSDPMLDGLVLPPKRKLYAVRSTAYSRRYFSLQTSIGAFALQS